MNSADIHQYISGLEQRYDDMVRIKDDLIKQNAALDGELEQALRERDQALEALRVAHDTIAKKQELITELEAQPRPTADLDSFIDDNMQFYSMIKAIISDHRNAWDRLPSGAKEMVSLYDRLVKMGMALRPETDGEKEGAA